MPECNGCDFNKLVHKGESWCVPAHAFVKDLDGFCPKEIDIEEVKKRCRYYLPVSEMFGGKSLCRAPFYEHGRYCSCWIESLDDLLRDPDFTLKMPDG